MTFNWRLEKGVKYLETGRPDLMELRAEVQGIDCRVWYEPPAQQGTEGGWCWSVGPPVEYADTADTKEQAMEFAAAEAAGMALAAGEAADLLPQNGKKLRNGPGSRGGGQW